MKKEYYNEQKANYIIKRLNSTKIDRIYWPLISDLMLRRQFEYDLSDDLLKRDIDTFIKNVKTIEVKEGIDGNGIFSPRNRKIILDLELFKLEDIDIYSTIAHEFTHAMNFEKIKRNVKRDRTFSYGKILDTRGIVEAFTECETDGLIYNISVEGKEDKIIPPVKTETYTDITPCIDIIAATFGIKRKELLSAAIKGEEEFQDLLNKNINKVNEISGKNKIFENISCNIALLHSASYQNETKVSEENVKNAITKIYHFSQLGINDRISNIEFNDIEEFREQFNKLKLDQAIIRYIMKAGYFKKNIKNFEEIKSEEHEIVNAKLRYMESILNNSNIKNKRVILRKLQKIQNIEEITEFLNYIDVDLDMSKKLVIPVDVIKRHNLEYSSNGMEWDNTDIVEYIQEHKEEMKAPKFNKLQLLQARIKNLFNRNEPKLLSEGTELRQPKPYSWDLSNWEIDKEEFMEKNEKFVEEYLSRKTEGQVQSVSIHRDNMHNDENIK